MSVLAIEETSIENNRVTVTAIVEDIRLLYPATYFEPAEYAPALCSASFELDDDTQVPADEDSFCSYLSDLDLEWKPVDTSDWDLD